MTDNLLPIQEETMTVLEEINHKYSQLIDKLQDMNEEFLQLQTEFSNTIQQVYLLTQCIIKQKKL